MATTLYKFHGLLWLYFCVYCMLKRSSGILNGGRHKIQGIRAQKIPFNVTLIYVMSLRLYYVTFFAI